MGKSKHLALCALGVAAVVATPAFAGVASVVDGSFESDPLGQITTETPTSTGWYMGSGPEAYGYTFIMNNDNNGSDTIHLSTLSPTTEGSQFLGSDPTYYPDSVNQDITGLTVGQTYVVSFEWAGGQQSGFTGTTTDFWAVSLGGGVPQDTATITVPSGGFSGWIDVTMDFTATAVDETSVVPPRRLRESTVRAAGQRVIDRRARAEHVGDDVAWLWRPQRRCSASSPQGRCRRLNVASRDFGTEAGVDLAGFLLILECPRADEISS